MKTDEEEKTNREIMDEQLRRALTRAIKETEKMQKDGVFYGIKEWLPLLIACFASVLALFIIVNKWG